MDDIYQINLLKNGTDKFSPASPRIASRALLKKKK